MAFIDKNSLEKLKKRYPKGTKIRLIKMDDIQAPPAGTLGTVTGVDDAGTIHTSWENGSSLGVRYGEDEAETVASPEPRNGNLITGRKMSDGAPVSGFVIGTEPFLYILPEEDVRKALCTGEQQVKLEIAAERILAHD